MGEADCVGGEEALKNKQKTNKQNKQTKKKAETKILVSPKVLLVKHKLIPERSTRSLEKLHHRELA